MEFAEIIVNNPLIIRLLKKEESLDNIKQYYVKCKDLDEKYAAITNIYGVITIGQAIIFCHVGYPKCLHRYIQYWANSTYAQIACYYIKLGFPVRDWTHRQEFQSRFSRK